MQGSQGDQPLADETHLSKYLFIGASLSEPHINGTSARGCAIYIHDITSVPSVCPLLDVRERGAASPVDLSRHKGRVQCTAVACHINKVRGGSTSLEQPAWPGSDARQRRSWPGEWAATELRLNMTTARARSRRRRQANSSGDI